MRSLLGIVVSLLCCFAHAVTPSDIDQLFVRDQTDPGCAVGYSRAGEIKYMQGFGAANLEHNIPITPATRFHVASISKSFTAAAIGLFILEGEISVTDNVRKHLPEFPDFGEVVTIEQLLKHTSGLSNHTVLMRKKDLDYGNSISTDRALDLVFTHGLSFPPGSQYQYSSSYLVLGRLVEKLSGLPLREFLANRIFTPLGMNDSGLHDDFSIIPNRAEGYLLHEGMWINDRVRYALIGSGGIHTSIEDLLVWDDALRRDRLKEGLADLVFKSPPATVTEDVTYHFGVFRSSHRGKPSTVHSGSYQGSKTVVYHSEPDLTTAIACNHKADIQQLTWDLISTIAPIVDEG